MMVLTLLPVGRVMAENEGTDPGPQKEPVVEKVKVTYEYVSGTAEKTLPTSLTAPTATKADKGSDVDVPKNPTPAEYSTEDGKWIFKGWNPNTKQTNVQTDVTFKGTWEFTKNENSDPGETPAQKLEKAKKSLKAKIDDA